MSYTEAEHNNSEFEPTLETQVEINPFALLRVLRNGSLITAGALTAWGIYELATGNDSIGFPIIGLASLAVFGAAAADEVHIILSGQQGSNPVE